MAKYTFAETKSSVLPLEGEFYTESSASLVWYNLCPDEKLVDLSVATQSFDQEDLEDLIEFLESLKEHLKGG